MIETRLQMLLAERRMKQIELARAIFVRPNTICDLYNGWATSINFTTLDLLCKELECDISDILRYVSNGNGRSNSYGMSL